MKIFEMQFKPRWSDLDPNQHLRHTAYNDHATQVRFSFLDENGYSQEQFKHLNIGPVLFREESTFRKEIGMTESFTVDFEVISLSKTGKKWCFAHNFWLTDSTLAATVKVEGSWINLDTRRFTSPPEDLLKLFQRIQANTETK